MQVPRVLANAYSQPPRSFNVQTRAGRNVVFRAGHAEITDEGDFRFLFPLANIQIDVPLESVDFLPRWLKTVSEFTPIQASIHLPPDVDLIEEKDLQGRAINWRIVRPLPTVDEEAKLEGDNPDGSSDSKSGDSDSPSSDSSNPQNPVTMLDNSWLPTPLVVNQEPVTADPESEDDEDEESDESEDEEFDDEDDEDDELDDDDADEIEPEDEEDDELEDEEQVAPAPRGPGRPRKS